MGCMSNLHELAQRVLENQRELAPTYRGGTAVVYYLVGHMLRLDPTIDEKEATKAAREVLEEAHGARTLRSGDPLLIH